MVAGTLAATCATANADDMQAWKAGTRGGKGKLMSLIVPLLSDEEIEQVSAYVASLK
jgi:cytochrome c553